MAKNIWEEGLFSPKKSKNSSEEQGRRTLWNVLNVLLVVGLTLLYPFVLCGAIPFVIIRYLNRKDRYQHIENMDYEGFLNRKSWWFISAGIMWIPINVILFFYIPRGYLATYLLFPFNIITNDLVFNYQSILALLMGGIGVCFLLLSGSIFFDRLRVTSKEEERNQVKNSKEYRKRHKNKFKESQKYTKNYEDEYQKMLEMSDYKAYKKEFNRLKQSILIGTDEFGSSYVLPLKELNQHGLMPATTGGGKTTLQQIFMEHCLKFNIPCVLIDGKGAKETLESMEGIAKKYGKSVVAFSDEHKVGYNPLKYGNSTEIKDRLVTIAETESVFYSSAAKSLLMNTIQLMDCFGIERSFETLSEYTLPRNVLRLFATALEENEVEVFVTYHKSQQPIRPKEKDEGTTKEVLLDIEMTDADEGSNNDSDEIAMEEVWERIVHDPDAISLEDYYFLVRKQFDELSETHRKLFNQLFIRYEYKESPFYLYATSESLQTNINMLIDSEVGQLFDTKHCELELDFKEIYRKNQLVYLSLNGLIYEEFIKQLAHFIIGDLKHLTAEIYKGAEKKKEILTLFDEPASYLDESFIAIANKARGAGVHAIFSPQTMTDIAKIDESLMKQLVGNVNTYMVGQVNEKDEASYWAEIFGTYRDLELTEMIEQADGFNNLNRTSWSGERGTKRMVDKFNIHPNDLKSLRTGEFYFYRKGQNSHEPIRKVYVRNPV
ncbi:TraM recognition domain-containing protein [Enterococcus sp. DIV0660C]|uniref:TraM recognition domain-containing protein n=1 Tax=Enterococcus sp. DIV0660C TaxID=2230880 RepID=UPI001A8D057B|nr:TraM recognition domain-containing protein [Enterococcus sp. DIV0660C]MBO0431278.1 TraM recognition domain-containing protein [Enterococcus sp. DIV0660C]